MTNAFGVKPGSPLNTGAERSALWVCELGVITSSLPVIFCYLSNPSTFVLYEHLRFQFCAAPLVILQSFLLLPLL